MGGELQALVTYILKWRDKMFIQQWCVTGWADEPDPQRQTSAQLFLAAVLSQVLNSSMSCLWMDTIVTSLSYSVQDLGQSPVHLSFFSSVQGIKDSEMNTLVFKELPGLWGGVFSSR